MQEITNKTVGARLELVINHYNMSPYEFSKALGFDRADKIYNILKDKFNPSFEILVAITNSFVELNIDWLITGNGDMLKGLEPEGEAKGIEQPPGCELCREKDKVIAVQAAQIATQSEYIELLKEQSPCESGQKRKAC